MTRIERKKLQEIKKRIQNQEPIVIPEIKKEHIIISFFRSSWRNPTGTNLYNKVWSNDEVVESFN